MKILPTYFKFKSLGTPAINTALLWGVAQQSAPFTRLQEPGITNCPV